MKDRSLRSWDEVHELIVTQGYKHALEIGCWDGVTTEKLAKVCETVDTIDVLDMEHVIERLRELTHVRFHRGNSSNVLREMAKAGKKFDFVLIDGLHTYAQAKSDHDLCVPLLNPPALVVIDDVDWSSGVRRAAREVGAEIHKTFALKAYL